MATTADNKFVSAGKFLFWALAFGIAYTQSPLYSSNQNTKFLHGLADAGKGFLNEDWLAGTLDPFPVFSFLVYVTYRYFHEALFYLYNVLIYGVYLYSLSAIAARIYKVDSSRSRYLTFLVILIALHSYAFDSLSQKIFGFELAQLHYGVAEYHIIGRIFQPSVFGVFIVLSIYAFLCEKPFLATFLLGLSAIIHPAYILCSAILTLSYMAITFREQKSAKKALAVGVFNLLLILPVVSYFSIRFSPTSAETWNNAQEVLVNFRSPHHLNPHVWLDGLVYAKVFLALIAMYLVRNTKLFPIMVLPCLTAVILTIAQVLSGDPSLAALAPWRIAVFLVPLSLSIIVAYLVTRFCEIFHGAIANNQKLLTSLNFAVALVLVLYGAATQVKRHAKYYRDDSIPMMNFVRETKSSGETYLIPVELEDFRLYTGAPTFVTFKSGPFKDIEYLEWYKRIVKAGDFYAANNNDVVCRVLKELETHYRLTHVVIKGPRSDPGCGNLSELYRDDKYRVYRIRRASSGVSPGKDV
jgi:hypothetical protein